MYRAGGIRAILAFEGRFHQFTIDPNRLPELRMGWGGEAGEIGIRRPRAAIRQNRLFIEDRRLELRAAQIGIAKERTFEMRAAEVGIAQLGIMKIDLL